MKRFHKMIYFALGCVFILMTGLAYCDTASDQGTTSLDKPQQATFGDVKGRVTIEHPHDTTVIVAHQGSTAMEGDRVTTGSESSAVLIMFDNSEIDLGPNSALTLSKMQKPAANDKLLEFVLFIGRMTAKVVKLASAQSAFEVSAGGVICGVRGTQFTMDYDPNKHEMSLRVDEGKVWASNNGSPAGVFTAGEYHIFTQVRTTSLLNLNNQIVKKDTTNNPGPVVTGPLSDPALQVMTNNIPQGVKTNTNNTLNSAQQNSSIGLHVGPGEVVP